MIYEYPHIKGFYLNFDDTKYSKEDLIKIESVLTYIRATKRVKIKYKEEIMEEIKSFFNNPNTSLAYTTESYNMIVKKLQDATIYPTQYSKLITYNSKEAYETFYQDIDQEAVEIKNQAYPYFNIKNIKDNPIYGTIRLEQILGYKPINIYSFNSDSEFHTVKLTSKAIRRKENLEITKADIHKTLDEYILKITKAMTSYLSTQEQIQQITELENDLKYSTILAKAKKLQDLENNMHLLLPPKQTTDIILQNNLEEYSKIQINSSYIDDEVQTNFSTISGNTSYENLDFSDNEMTDAKNRPTPQSSEKNKKSLNSNLIQNMQNIPKNLNTRYTKIQELYPNFKEEEYFDIDLVKIESVLRYRAQNPKTQTAKHEKELNEIVNFLSNPHFSQKLDTIQDKYNNIISKMKKATRLSGSLNYNPKEIYNTLYKPYYESKKNIVLYGSSYFDLDNITKNAVYGTIRLQELLGERPIETNCLNHNKQIREVSLTSDSEAIAASFQETEKAFNEKIDLTILNLTKELIRDLPKDEQYEKLTELEEYLKDITFFEKIKKVVGLEKEINLKYNNSKLIAPSNHKIDVLVKNKASTIEQVFNKSLFRSDKKIIN